MKRLLIVLAAVSAAVSAASAAGKVSSVRRRASGLRAAHDFTVTADRITADRKTGAVSASGNVRAVAKPVTLLSERVERDATGLYTFSDPTALTTCSNHTDCLHWKVSGEVTCRNGEYIRVKDATLELFHVPIFWVPYWYYPINTDYGWRVMPGYTSRWGGFLLTKYVYGLWGDLTTDPVALGGDTRVDVRTKNGVAVGQTLRWKLGDFGVGKFKAYYAWDDDSDRYDRHWKGGKWNYRNWGSEVPHDRYGLDFTHRAEVTERDLVRVKAAYYSDSHFRRDFLKDRFLGAGYRFVDYDGNEAAWEHVENGFGAGLSVTGPMNDFYGGTARLPEGYFDVAPQPVFGLPVNYESQTRVGYLNRSYAHHGDRETSLAYRADPGIWADYNCFRLDTYHRLTLPFKVADVLSVVPRVGYRATYWSESGFTSLDGTARAGSAADDLTRSVVEGGVTFAARGTADFADGWRHIVEPYADVLAQEAFYANTRRGARPYVFDSLDASQDWLDQFAGRSRNLPYSWYGVTPGVRNAFRRSDAKGVSRAVADVDVYAAVQVNETDWTDGDRYHRLARHPWQPNYGRNSPVAVPGVRLRWFPTEETAFTARAEYDTDNDKVAYADVAWHHRLSRRFRYEIAYFARDHRIWDFSSSPYDPEYQAGEGFNWASMGYAEVGFEHELCDAFAWSPYLRWDCQDGDLDEVGSWFDLRTDCLGFRFNLAYENDYRRIDRSLSKDDWRFGFFVYLRALGPTRGSPFGG